MAEPLLEARGLEKIYRRGAERVRAVVGVDLALYPGELVALVGPSGSGKSSLLGVLAGWEPPDAGQLSRPPAPRGEPGWSELATVPQALGLLEDLTVRENVALPVRLQLGPARAGEGRTEELLGLLGLAALPPDVLVEETPEGARYHVPEDWFIAAPAGRNGGG